LAELSVPETTYRARSIYPLILLAIYAVIWALLAIEPLYRDDWLLENVLPAITLPVLWFTRRYMRFSNFTYTLLFLFMALHAVGSHYTYAEVPYDSWFQALTGTKLNPLLGFERNHFDRLLHFLYGLLIFPVYWELFSAKAGARPFWLYLFTTTFMFSHGAVYEIIEWAAAAWFGGDLGVAYLGTQGDEWDAQKDMGLAMGGSVLALLILLGYRRSRPR
jgi:putative membrane protein